MRDIWSWKKEIKDSLQGYLDEESQLTASEFCDLELGLTLWYDLFPEESAYNLWGILTGYFHNIPSKYQLKNSAKRKIALARFYLVNMKSRKKWEESLEYYASLEESIRLFTLDGKMVISKQETAILPQREEIYYRVLNQSPPHEELKTDFCHPGKAYIKDEKKDKVIEVVIPEKWFDISQKDKELDKLFLDHTIRKRKKINLNWEELLKTAQWIDDKSGSKYYYKKLKEIKLKAGKNKHGKKIKNNKQEITLNGLFHLVGMLGTGKSLFMEVFSVWAARENYHTTLILDSIMSIIKMTNFFSKLGIKVAPIFGRTNRDKQIKRFHQVYSINNIEEIKSEKLKGMEWLNTACPLAGQTKREPLNFEPGKEPCFNLYDKNPFEYKRLPKKICPYISKCPVHSASNALARASVWLATPASMVYTQVPSYLLGKKVLFYELIYRKSDFLLIDEVDRVQVQVDNFFAPNQLLVDESGNSWFDSLGLNESEFHYSGGRFKLLSRHKTERWALSVQEVQRCVDSLMSLLGSNMTLYKWIKEELLTFDTLKDKIICELKNKVEYKKVNELEKIFTNFNADPIGFKYDHELVNISSSLVNNFAGISGRASLTKWLRRYLGDLVMDEEILDKVNLLLVIARLEANLLEVLNNWDEANRLLNLKIEKLSYFQFILDDYLPLIPESPMGNIFGFKYSRDNNRVSLHMFRFKGLGRYLLLNFPHLFSLSDEYDGPHTIAISGTSWSPGSTYYHFQKGPDLLLETNEKMLKKTKDLKFIFKPAYDKKGQAIAVSGSRNKVSRQNSLKYILDYLSTPNIDPDKSKSFLEQELLNIKNENRRKILLLVGSYEEAKIAKEFLQEKSYSFQSLVKKDIVQLIRDDEEIYSDESIIQRGKVQEFPHLDAKILIAPLLAIERGHNILNDENVAALGSAFFLVRPMPVPTDILPTVLSLNQWAISSMVDNLKKSYYKDKDEIGARSKKFRSQAMDKFKNMLNFFAGGTKYLSEEELKTLYWNQFVVIWQAIGRLIRGGVGARVYFVDASFATKSAKGEVDSMRTSMIVGIREILSIYFKENKSSEIYFENEIAKNLYGPFYNAIKVTKGVIG